MKLRAPDRVLSRLEFDNAFPSAVGHTSGGLQPPRRKRIEDLEALRAREFSVRHKVDIDVVFETRRKLCSAGALAAA
jgi:hypothetical protein